MGRCVKGGSDEYIYGNGFNEIVAMMDNTGYRTYMLTDAHGSVVCETASSEYISEIRYDAYGNIELATEPCYRRFGYAGMRYEANADIYLTPNRAYSPTLGRWLSPDPLGTIPNAKTGNRFSPLAQYTDGLNLYAYCGNNPVNQVDQMGLSTVISLKGSYTFDDYIIYDYEIELEVECRKSGGFNQIRQPDLKSFNRRNLPNKLGFLFYSWNLTTDFDATYKTQNCPSPFTGQIAEYSMQIKVYNETYLGLTAFGLSTDWFEFRDWVDYEGTIEIDKITIDCCESCESKRGK